jgi:hypothetical protein
MILNKAFAPLTANDPAQIFTQELLMKQLLICLLICTLFSTALKADELSSSTRALSAIDLVKKVETQYQGETSHGRMKMSIKNRNWSRTLIIESWSEGRDKMLTKILSPIKERGTCTLKVDDDIWNYISRIDRLIKIPSSLMGDSWMGSHLTNDDLVKENKIDRLYDLKITSETTEEIAITGIPLPEAAVVWGKIIYRIDPVKLVPIEVEYYDEDEKIVRTMEFSEVKQVEQRWLPMRMRIQPIEKPEEYTEMLYEEIDFNVKLDANLFSIKNLRNR